MAHPQPLRVTVGATPTRTSTWPPRGTSSAAGLTAPARQPAAPATRRCWPGRTPWARSRPASAWWRSTGPTGRRGGGGVRATRSTPPPPPARCRPARPPGSRRPRTGWWRCCARCERPGRPPSRPGPRRSTPSRGCWSAARRPAHWQAGPRRRRARAGAGWPPRSRRSASPCAAWASAARSSTRGRAAHRPARPAHQQACPGAARPARPRPRQRHRAAGRRRRHPRRLRSEAAFAALCGTSPVQASSGKTRRHPLNRGGDRQANAALHRVVVVRLRWHQPTRDDAARCTARGKTRKEVMRCSSARSPEKSSQSSARSTSMTRPPPRDPIGTIWNPGRPACVTLSAGSAHRRCGGWCPGSSASRSGASATRAPRCRSASGGREQPRGWARTRHRRSGAVAPGGRR
jgi:hypothetical protein